MATAATAQVQTRAPQPITGPVKDAGTYHLATGTWTRNQGASSLLGPNQLYDNTCTVGYYVGLPEGAAGVDSGRIPSTDDGGTANCYEINCFQFGYCTFEPITTDLCIAYYECYAVCDVLSDASPVSAYSLVNLPGGGAFGTQGCWIVTIDMTNTASTFQLTGNGNGAFDNVPSTDHFGWSWAQVVPTTGSDAGPILAGDPLGNFNQSCGVAVTPSGQGSGTDHPGWGSPIGPGTGIGTELDHFSLGDATTTGCFWFGGYNSSSNSNPLAAFYQKLWGAPSAGCTGCPSGPSGLNQGTPFCFGDGTGSACPGAVVGSPGNGCPHQAGPNGALGANLAPTGDARFSNNTYGFAMTQGPSSLGIIIQGGMAIAYPNGIALVPDSAGLLCLSPQLRGFVEPTPLDSINSGDSDAAMISDFRNQPFSESAQPIGCPTFNQFWFRDEGNPNATPGPGAEFNFSNAVETYWTW